MENVYIDEHLSITKSCHCVKRETESLFVRFTMYHLLSVEFIGIPTETLLML